MQQRSDTSLFMVCVCLAILPECFDGTECYKLTVKCCVRTCKPVRCHLCAFYYLVLLPTPGWCFCITSPMEVAICPSIYFAIIVCASFFVFHIFHRRVISLFLFEDITQIFIFRNYFCTSKCSPLFCSSCCKERIWRNAVVIWIRYIEWHWLIKVVGSVHWRSWSTLIYLCI